MSRAIGLIAFAVLGVQAAEHRVGSALRAGSRLVYGGGAQSQPAWVIDSVRADTSFGGRARCTVIWLRVRPEPAPAEVRTNCVGGDTLFTFDRATQAWRPQRPTGSGVSLDVAQANGSTLRYTTGARGVATIGDQRIDVVETTVLTVDASGRPTRRLRERFSLAIASAVAGVFEVPDSTAAGGWRETQRFELQRFVP